MVLFIIFVIIGFVIWMHVLADEEADNYEEYRFFKSVRKRKIACIMLGPGAWIAELMEIIMTKICNSRNEEMLILLYTILVIIGFIICLVLF